MRAAAEPVHNLLVWEDISQVCVGKGVCDNIIQVFKENKSLPKLPSIVVVSEYLVFPKQSR